MGEKRSADAKKWKIMREVIIYRAADVATASANDT